ncbi:MAG: GCN5-related N-acetyltransferase [Clostridia bacterium]|nr:GCN5-related N-acetyltransferase [Clostridia bacterium]
MQEFAIQDIKAFADAVKDLYKVFFKRYPMLKPFIIKALLYDNGNYGLLIKEKNLVKAKYTIYNSSQGFIIERNIKSSINMRFEVESSVVADVLNKKQEYINKPYKLIKYLPGIVRGMTLVSQRLYIDMLEGSKVFLRPYEENDMPYLLKWYNDNELNKLAGWSKGKTSASKLKYNMSRSFGSDPMNLMIDDLNGKPIGTIQLYDLNEQDKSCKLGIRIGDKDYWSKGYGGDAVNTIVEYAFTSMDKYRVDLRVYEFNGRAAHCYEKCGFKVEGRSRKSAYIDGEYYDEILMGLLKSEFFDHANKAD